MEYALSGVLGDVLRRLGETAGAEMQADIFAPAEALRLKIISLLPAVGRRLIAGATADMLGGAENLKVESRMRKAACGLHACLIPLPPDFVRLVSLRMRGWRRSVNELTVPESDAYQRQWSEEAGIAGSPSRPMAYLCHEAGGPVIEAVGSVTAEDEAEHCLIWRAPAVGADGNFSFPAALYDGLVDSLVAEVSGMS